jgi:hypothetical protein
MTRRLTILAVCGAAVSLLSAFAVGVQVGRAPDTRVYELRTYTTNPGRLPALQKRFADHTMRLFSKYGMRNELYFVPTDSARRDHTLIYLISHESQAAADRSWKAFSADTMWVRVRTASEADGTILAKPPERVFMRMTEYSPAR